MSDHDEDRLLHALLNSLNIVETWEQLTGQPSGAWHVEPGSDLDGDDAVTHPYQVSTAAWVAITAAVNHAACLRDSLFLWTDADHATVRLHTHGQLTLIRGALENASRAIWLLESDERSTRVLRRLQQEWSEVGELEKMRKIASVPSTRPLHKRLEDLSIRALLAGVDPTKIKVGARYKEIVEAAGERVPSGSQVAVFIWKACSAIAHGEVRGLTAYLTAETLGQAASGMVLNRITANVQLTVTGTLTALAATKISLDLYTQRAGSASGDLSDTVSQ